MARNRQFAPWLSSVVAFVLSLLTHQRVVGQGEDVQEVVVPSNMSDRLLTASGTIAGFDTALTTLETGVLSTLQKVHALTDGDTQGDIDILDGSFDVFDNGNKIRISANGVTTDFLQYTQQCDGSTTLAGVGDVHYFTCKLTKIWIAAFYSESESMDGFYIDGNNGADGKGSANGGIFWESGGMAAGTFVHYKAVIGTGGSNGDSEDPSINTLVMVPSNGWYNNISTDTDDGQHWVVQESGNPVAQIVYVLFTGHDAEGKASFNYNQDPDYINVITEFRQNFPDLLLFTTTSTTTTITSTTTTSKTTTVTTSTVTTSTVTTVTETTSTITTTPEPTEPPPTTTTTLAPTDPPTETATTSTYTTITATTVTATTVTATTSSTSSTSSSFTVTTTITTSSSTSSSSVSTTVTTTVSTSTSTSSTSSATTTLSSTTTISTSTSSTSTLSTSTSSTSTSSATTSSSSTTSTVTSTATTSTSSTSTSSMTTSTSSTSTATTSTTRTTTGTTTTSSTSTSTRTTSTVTTQSTTTSTSATTTGTTTSSSTSTMTTSTSTSSTTSTLTTTVSSTTSSTSTTTGTTTTTSSTTSSTTSTLTTTVSSTTSSTTTTTGTTSTTSTTTSSTTTTRSTTSSTTSSTSSTSSSSISSTTSTTSTTTSTSSSTTTSSTSSTTSSTTTTTVSSTTSSTSSSTSSTTTSSTTTSSTTTSTTSTSTSSTSSTTTSSSSSSTTTSTWPDDPFFYNITTMAVVLRKALPGLQLMPEVVSGTTSMQDGILWEDGNKIGVKAGGKTVSDLGYVQQCLGQANYTGVSDVSYFTCQVNPQVFTAGFFSHDRTISEFEVSGQSPGGTLRGSGIGRSVQALDLGDHGSSSGDRRLTPSASYRGFGKQVYGGGLPSLNHLIMVPSNGGPGWYHEMGGNSGDNLHVVKQGTGSPVSEIYYLAWAGPEDVVYTSEQFTNAMGVVVDFMPDIIPYLLTTTTTSSTSYTRTQTTRTGTTSTATTTTNTTSTSTMTTSTVTTSTVTTTTLTTTITRTTTTMTNTTTVTTSTVTTSTVTTSTVTTSTMTTTTPTTTTTTSMTVTTTSITDTTSTATTSTMTTSTGTTTTGTTTTATTVTVTTETTTTETVTTTTVSTSTVTTTTVTTITRTTTTEVFPAPTDTSSAMTSVQRDNAGVAEEMRKILRDSGQWRYEFTTADGRQFVIQRFSWDLENITVPFDLGDGTTISVFVPVQALLQIGVSDDEAGIFIAPVEKEILDLLKGSTEGQEVAAVVQIELVYLMAPGAFIDVQGLDTPIVFTLPVNYTKTMGCWVWDFDKNLWTNEGLTTVKGLGEDEQLQCTTTHLSFFGALFQGFLDTLLCGQFGLFTAENIGNLAKNDWHKQTGSIVFFCIVGLLLATFIAATFLDWKRDQTMTWKSEFFLIPLYDGPPAEGEVRDEETIHEAETEDVHPSEHGPVMAFFCGIVALFASLWACITESSAVRDAFDDIVSEWFEYVGELRSIIEGICDALECSACCATGAFAAVTHSMMVSMTLNTSRKLAGASMRLSDDVVSFVMEDEDLHDILLRHQELAAMHEVMAREGTWRRADGREEVWARLHDEIGKALQKEINTQTHCRHLPTSMWNLFLVHTPFGGVCVFDIFSSCKMRAFFFAIEMVGALLMCSLFFQASGKLSPPSVANNEGEDDEECGEENPPIAYRIGRLMAISLGSVFISGFPVHFLSSLHTRHFKKFEYEGCPHWNHQLRVWQIQDRMIWILGSMYIAFGLFFVSLFLANISADDHEDFMMGGIISVIQDCVVIPACIALIGPCFAAVLIVASSKMQGLHRTDLLRGVHHRLHEDTNIMLPIMQI